MMQLIVVNEESEELYNEFVQHHPESNIYHTLAWKDLIQSVYGYRSLYYLVIDNNRPIACFNLFDHSSFGLGKKFSQIPYSHHVPLLIDDEYEQTSVLRLISEKLDELPIVFKTDLNIEKNSVQKLSKNYISILQLVDEDQIWNGFNKSNVQRSIKKANKSDLVLDSSNELESYQAFYELQAITRKKQGSPMYSEVLFTNLYHMLAKKDLAKCFIAKNSDNLPIAGLITLSFNGKTIYAYGGSSNTPEHMSKRPNHFLMWHAIRTALETGDYLFDFGSTPKGHQNLLRYKSYWGASTDELVYSYINTSSIKGIDRESALVNLATKFFQIAPIWLNKQIGPILLKYLG